MRTRPTMPADLERRELRLSWLRGMAACCWPKVFDSSIPETERVSSVAADISASDFWVSPRTSRLTLPTRNVRYMKNGRRPRLRTVRRQSMMTMAMIVLMAIATFEVSEAAVSVTTDCTPLNERTCAIALARVVPSVAEMNKGIDTGGPSSDLASSSSSSVSTGGGAARAPRRWIRRRNKCSRTKRRGGPSFGQCWRSPGR